VARDWEPVTSRHELTSRDFSLEMRHSSSSRGDRGELPRADQRKTFRRLAVPMLAYILGCVGIPPANTIIQNSPVTSSRELLTLALASGDRKNRTSLFTV